MIYEKFFRFIYRIKLLPWNPDLISLLYQFLRVKNPNPKIGGILFQKIELELRFVLTLIQCCPLCARLCTFE